MIDTRLNYDDIGWLIKAAEAWEEKNTEEFYFAKQILSIPELDEDNPAFEMVQHFKARYRGKEQVLADKKDATAEQAATMKARLYYLKRVLGTNGLFDVEQNEMSTPEDASQKNNPSDDPSDVKLPDTNAPVSKLVETSASKLSKLKRKMAAAAQAEDFPLAALLRDEIKALEKLDEK